MKELFLVSCAGVRYGIWKDDVQAVRSIDALHRIPLSPARIAGIMIDGGQTVTLANLPVCIGSAPALEIERGCVLLVKAGDKPAGFVVDGELGTLAVSAQEVYPLPGYLRTRAFDACAVHDNIPIPLINIAELHPSVPMPGEGAPVCASPIPGATRMDISGVERISLFGAGGELFAVPAAGMADAALRPGPVSPLPDMPQYVKGIAFCNGRLLPVVDLSQRLKGQDSSPECLMVEAGVGDAAFGLLIDGKGATVAAGQAAVRPLPFIAQTAWLKHVVMFSGELIPLVDLAMALSQGSADDDSPAWQRYAPASAFPEAFFRSEVEVVEFSLLGERYALPKDEVEDVISFKPCRGLFGVPPIVIGVAEHDGEVLPVVDLAMMFGRRSLATPVWRMMVVRNGNFRALVVTETVYQTRLLPAELHRAVPVHLPHNLMYGCYPDGKAARIILNAGAIAVHFEESLIQKFFPALSPEMSGSPPGAVHASYEAAVSERAEEIEPVRQDETAIAGNSPAPNLVAMADASDEAHPADDLLHSRGDEDAVAPPPGASGAPEPSPAAANFEPGEQQHVDPDTENISPLSVHEGQRSDSWGRVAFDMAAAGVIASLLLFLGALVSFAAEKPVITSGAEKAGAIKGNVDSAGENAWQATANTGPRPMDNSPAPLELVIPKSMSRIEISEYVVVQGDTLWSISMRFTGSPFNYPRIAGGNQIANADLIFPGQRIRLIK